MKKVLIIGKNSFIGEWFISHSAQHQKEIVIDVVDSMGQAWRDADFAQYDTVLHLAGIAHETKKSEDDLYMRINRDLAVEVATVAKENNVAQFIFMSTIRIYSGVKKGKILADTKPKADSVYGESKLQADLMLQAMADESFSVAVVRPPMIFGEGCKGNFPRLVSLSKKVPIFPKYNNSRSMLYIGNLCEFLALLVEAQSGGIFFPQNLEYYCTSEIISTLATLQGRKIKMTRLINWCVSIAKKLVWSFEKAFGNLTYDKNMSDHFDFKYCLYDNSESLKRSIQIGEINNAK